MNWLQALILGVVQGLTEFLPVSSSAHLVIFQKLLGLQEHSLEFDIIVHLGTVLAIFTFYRKDLLHILVDTFLGLKDKRYSHGLRVIKLVTLASIPTAIIGLLFKEQFELLFSNLSAVGLFLCVTGIMLFSTRNKGHGNIKLELDQNVPAMTDISWKSALIIGTAQGCAIAPGISRSGTTISAALFCNISRNSAAKFSFLLSIPAILGAATLELRHSELINFNSIPMWTGFVTAYATGLFSLSLVIKLVNKGKLQIFSGYLIALGLTTFFLGTFKL